MAAIDASPPPIRSPPPENHIAPPIGAGSVDTSEMDCEIIRESILPKWYAGPHTGGFPRRVLPPLFPPSISPGHTVEAKSPHLPTPVEAPSNHPFIFHGEATRASSLKRVSSADRPHKRKRCSGLTKDDKLALITICTKHKADYKQGDKTGFWELVKKSMLAETGKELAQPRSMVERWCNWDIDQTLERQTTDDQQDFRIAVREFSTRWKEVRQEYNSRRQSKASTTEDTVQALADQPKESLHRSLHGDDDDVQAPRFQSLPRVVPHSELDITIGRFSSESRFDRHVSNGDISDNRAPRSDAPAIKTPRIDTPSGNTSVDKTRDSNACANSLNVSVPTNSDAPTSNAAKSNTPGANTSNVTVPEGHVPKGNSSNDNVVTSNIFKYNSSYPWAQGRIGLSANEHPSTTPSNTVFNNKAEIVSASLPTPRASISGSQSSTSSPITSMDFRHFPQIRPENTRSFGLDTPQSSSRVMSSPIDSLAQAYVTRTYEASFDILREIMTRHDEIVRRLSASKESLAADFEASKRRTEMVERQLENARPVTNDEKGALTAQLEKLESQNVASQQLIDSLQRQKVEAAVNFHESQQQLQLLQHDNEALKKELDKSKRLNVQTNTEVEISKSQVETNKSQTESKPKIAGAEKELEACQRQIIKIKNEKYVLELELSVSKRQIQELKARISNPTKRPEGSPGSHDGIGTVSEKTT